ncbi:MAG: DegT/DnrJ/EryC1/StrS aminotransferase family protein [Acidobacteria bacterium]|nr:DegT/DnrJ/EryC1/StrS aminotransferase family protein [Acidobacteriota bacterium]
MHEPTNIPGGRFGRRCSGGACGRRKAGAVGRQTRPHGGLPFLAEVRRPGGTGHPGRAAQRQVVPRPQAAPKAGTFGDTGCFSFEASKNLKPGEGGAILADNGELAERSTPSATTAGAESLGSFGRTEHADPPCCFAVAGGGRVGADA